MFFSIPYDDGWTATVNGKPAEIEKVNIGFMAVKVSGHEKSEIKFSYRTPLLREGVILSCIGIGLFILYIAVTLIIRKGKLSQRTYRRKHRIKQNSHTKEASL